MKKKSLAITSFLLITASAMPLAVKPFANISAAAQSNTLQADCLIAPTSYEQYLPLTSPADVAVNNDYTAIAQQNVIYVYDRLHGSYRSIDVSSKTTSAITKMQFADNDRLYFLDSNMLLYYLDVETDAITSVTLPCTTFLIVDEYLFYTASAGGASTLYKTSSYEPSVADSQKLDENLSGTPALAFWNDELYYTDESRDTHLYKIDPDTGATVRVGGFSERISAMSIADGVLACSMEYATGTGDFFTFPITDVSQNAAFAHFEGSFSAVTSLGNLVYVIEGDVVKQYSVQTHTFTDYEICSASASVNRLNGAAVSCMYKDKLFIADNGNARISVYDVKTATYQTPVSIDFSPAYIAAYENTLLIADNQQAVLYDISTENYGEKITVFNNFHGDVVGVASVYGTYYLLTKNNCFYTLTQSPENGQWEITPTQKSTTQFPDLLTSDAYGVLYVLSGNDVYAFTEQSALTANTEGEKVCSFSASIGKITQIAVDYNQTVYALANNQIYFASQTVDFSQPLVYYADNNATPQINAFAFGIEENQTYVLCDNTYVLKSERLNLPTVKTIAVNGADEDIFQNASAEFSILQTNENALLVQFDMQALQGATYFPYLATQRNTERKTALKIGETDKHYLIAHFEEATNDYHTYLVRKTDCTQLPASTYQTDYTHAEQRKGYITSDVALYKFPYLTDLLTVATLPRGTQVTILGEINQLDHAYYRVHYTLSDGTICRGYIPQAFTNDFSGLPPQSQSYQTGATESDTDAIWRMAYLLLGFGAICILTDYLLLRRKKNDNNNDNENNDASHS